MIRKKLALGLAVIGLSAATAIGGTFAWFTSSPGINGNGFTTGRLAISLSGSGANTGVIDLSSVANGLLPGGTSRATSLKILNSGTADLAFFGKTTVDTNNDAILDKLYIDSCTLALFKPDGTQVGSIPVIQNGLGVGAAASYITAAAGSPTSKLTLRDIKNADSGFEPMGALKPGYYGTITFKLGFVGDAGDTFQNSWVNLSYQASGTQINADALNALVSGSGTADNLSLFNTILAQNK